MSMITACIPYLKPFYESLQSGLIRSDDLRRRGLGTSSARYYYKKSGDPSAQSSHGSNWGLKNMSAKLSPPHELQSIASITATPMANGYREFDRESESSRAHIIRETTTFSVTSDKRDLPSS